MKKRLFIFTIIIFIFLPFFVYSGITIQGQLTHEFFANPGGSYSGSIIIQNSGTEKEEVMLYQKDYRSEAGGKQIYLDPDTTPRSNASWLVLSPRQFFIPPGESYSAHFTINVPEGETLSGSYWSLLMVEPVPKESALSSDYNPDEVNVGVQTILRYGIRMISQINGTGTIQPEIVNAKLMKDEKNVFLMLDIFNKGTGLVRVNSWAELYTENGDFTGKFQGEHLAIFPGSSIRFRIDFEDVPKNKYLALIVLDCGDNNVFGINYDLVFE